MRRTYANLVLDAVSLVVFAALSATGLLLKYRLPPGTGGGSGTGRLHGGGLAIWGMTRHEWGFIHLLVAASLVALIALHLALHWPWICAMIRARQERGTLARRALVLGAAALALALVLSPFFLVPRRLDPGPSGQGSEIRRDMASAPASPGLR